MGQARRLLQHRLPTGSQSSLSICLFWCGVLHRLDVDFCSPWTSMGWRGITDPTVVFTTGCWAVSAPVPGSPPLPLPSLTLLSAELLLSSILTPLFSPAAAAAAQRDFISMESRPVDLSLLKHLHVNTLWSVKVTRKKCLWNTKSNTEADEIKR